MIKNKKGQSVKYEDTKESVVGIYLGNLILSAMIFAVMYFLMSSVLNEKSFFIGFRNMLDMSLPLYTYFMAISFTTVIMYGYDKLKAISGLGMRVPEMVLHILEAFGGSLGAIVSQSVFRHKKRKTSFYKITWMIIVIQGTFLLLPYILRLPHDQQMLLAVAVPVLLLILYFLDAVMGILSTLYALMIISGGLFALYYVFSKL